MCCAVTPSIPQEASSQWILHVVQQPDFPSPLHGSAQLSAAAKQAFLGAALRQPRLGQNRFEMLVGDFAALCRREGTEDALLAYQE